MQGMWLLIFNLWYEKKKGNIKQYIHLQKGLKTKQMIIINLITKAIITILVLIIIITITIVIIIIIKQKVNSL